MFRPRSVGGDKRQTDFRLHGARKFDLGFFRGFTQTLKRHLVAFQINAGFFFEFLDDVVDQDVVHVRAAELVVPARRQNFKRRGLVRFVPTHFEDRDVERSAAQIKNHNFLFFAGFIQTVRQTRGRRFVDDAQDIKARDLAGVFGRLTLIVVKIRRNGDDRLFDFFAQKFFGVGFDFLQIILF